MKSMTGYGKAEYNESNVSLVIELKTVNNRFLDVVPKYPRIFIRFDDLIRKTIAEKLSRGRVELFITLNDTRETNKPVEVDLSLANGYFAAYQKLKNNFPSVIDDFSITSLMRLGDIVKEGASETSDDFYKSILISTLNSALDNLNESRFVEGEKLKKDLAMRNKTVAETVEKISVKAPEIALTYRTKLEERIREIVKEHKLDEVRLLQEVAIFADKSNIDEELTRLRSHTHRFADLIETDNCGRPLDFLVQEFNREANTICSKSNDVSVTEYALALKCEIEKIREQVQNIE